MLSNILAPVGYGHPQKSCRLGWFGLAALHSVSTMIAAVAVGMVLALLAGVIRGLGVPAVSWAFWSAVVIALAYVPRQLGWTRFPRLVQSTKQVPREWADDYPRPMTAILFGLGLGSGLATRIIVPTFYLLLLWPFLDVSLLATALIWAAYGLARSLHVWFVAWTAPATADDFFPHVHRVTFSMLGSGRAMHRANAVFLLIVVAWLVISHYHGTVGISP